MLWHFEIDDFPRIFWRRRSDWILYRLLRDYRGRWILSRDVARELGVQSNQVAAILHFLKGLGLAKYTTNYNAYTYYSKTKAWYILPSTNINTILQKINKH